MGAVNIKYKVSYNFDRGISLICKIYKVKILLKLIWRVTGDTAQCELREKPPPFSFFASIFCFTEITIYFGSSGFFCLFVKDTR